MKKSTGTFKKICGKKWKLISIVLILIFSIIVVSGAVEKISTEVQGSADITSGPKIIKVQATENQENSAGTLGLNLQPAPAKSENAEGLQIIQKNEEPQIQADESADNSGKAVVSNSGSSTKENTGENTGENNIVDNAINRQGALEIEKRQTETETTNIRPQAGTGNTPEVINSANEGSDGQTPVQEKKNSIELYSKENADKPAASQENTEDKQKDETGKNVIIVKNEEKPENPKSPESYPNPENNLIQQENSQESSKPAAQKEEQQQAGSGMTQESTAPVQEGQKSPETGQQGKADEISPIGQKENIETPEKKEETEKQAENPENKGDSLKNSLKNSKENDQNPLTEEEKVDTGKSNEERPESSESKPEQTTSFEESGNSQTVLNGPNTDNNERITGQEQGTEDGKGTDTSLEGQQTAGKQEEQTDNVIAEDSEKKLDEDQGKGNTENADTENSGTSPKVNIIRDNEGNNPEISSATTQTTDQVTNSGIKEKENKKEAEEGAKKETEINAGSTGLIKTGEKSEVAAKMCPAVEVQKYKVEISKVKMKACSVTYSPENKGTKSEPKTVTFNWTCPQKTENETQNAVPGLNPEVNKSEENNSKQNVSEENETEEDSWQNIKFILSHTYSSDSFYTTHENVKIEYDGPEALEGQKVDVYIVKKNSPDFSEEEIPELENENGGNDPAIFEKLIREDTESYIQIPAVLNEKGDLLPLTFDPLPAGDYWTVITLAEERDIRPSGPGSGADSDSNLKTDSESNSEPNSELENQKQILSANYFKVLEYEMRAEVPGAVKEGEDFGVNLSLEGNSEEGAENYTYWAVLINEDAYKADLKGNSGGIQAGIENFLSGINFLVNSESGSSDSGANFQNAFSSEPDSSKAKFKMEVQKLIGEGKGAITIGEENQKALFLTSTDLVPGNYFLFAGAYEKDKGLTGMVQKKLTIYVPKIVPLDGKASASPEDSSGSTSIKEKPLSILESKDSIFNSLEAVSFENLSPKIGDAAVQAGILIRDPPKIPSLILGFIVTLLSGLAIVKIRRQP